MISVVISKMVADAFGKDGIYGVWIAMRKYPWLPPVDYRDRGETAAQIMTPVERLVALEDGCTLRDIGVCRCRVSRTPLADAHACLLRQLGEEVRLSRLPCRARSGACGVCHP